MNDFDYEVKQKKDLARSAAHRVRGSKSTKCDLPSDHLTAAQKRALSGPVESYNLSGPMRWAEFKRMPNDLKKMYITQLRADYRASDAMLGNMFGVSGAAVYKARAELGIQSCERGWRPTKAIKAAWEQYINPQSEPIVPEEPETAAEEVTTPDPVAPEVEEQPLVVEKVQNTLQQFSMDFCDISTWEELYAYCKQFPNPGKGSYIRIRVDAR